MSLNAFMFILIHKKLQKHSLKSVILDISCLGHRFIIMHNKGNANAMCPCPEISAVKGQHLYNENTPPQWYNK